MLISSFCFVQHCNSMEQNMQYVRFKLTPLCNAKSKSWRYQWQIHDSWFYKGFHHRLVPTNWTWWCQVHVRSADISGRPHRLMVELIPFYTKWQDMHHKQSCLFTGPWTKCTLWFSSFQYSLWAASFHSCIVVKDTWPILLHCVSSFDWFDWFLLFAGICVCTVLRSCHNKPKSSPRYHHAWKLVWGIWL